jgi:hypothetical protein
MPGKASEIDNAARMACRNFRVWTVERLIGEVVCITLVLKNCI